MALTVDIEKRFRGFTLRTAFEAGNETMALLGASGVVFMMIVMSSLAGTKEGKLPLTLILVLLLYLGGEILDGLTKQDNVSQLTHVIGGLCGAFLGLSLRK